MFSNIASIQLPSNRRPTGEDVIQHIEYCKQQLKMTCVNDSVVDLAVSSITQTINSHRVSNFQAEREIKRYIVNFIIDCLKQKLSSE